MFLGVLVLAAEGHQHSFELVESNPGLDGLVVLVYTFCEVVDDAGNVVAGG